MTSSNIPLTFIPQIHRPSFVDACRTECKSINSIDETCLDYFNKVHGGVLFEGKVYTKATTKPGTWGFILNTLSLLDKERSEDASLTTNPNPIDKELAAINKLVWHSFMGAGSVLSGIYSTEALILALEDSKVCKLAGKILNGKKQKVFFNEVKHGIEHPRIYRSGEASKRESLVEQCLKDLVTASISKIKEDLNESVDDKKKIDIKERFDALYNLTESNAILRQNLLDIVDITATYNVNDIVPIKIVKDKLKLIEQGIISTLKNPPGNKIDVSPLELACNKLESFRNRISTTSLSPKDFGDTLVNFVNKTNSLRFQTKPLTGHCYLMMYDTALMGISNIDALNKSLTSKTERGTICEWAGKALDWENRVIFHDTVIRSIEFPHGWMEQGWAYTPWPTETQQKQALASQCTGELVAAPLNLVKEALKTSSLDTDKVKEDLGYSYGLVQRYTPLKNEVLDIVNNASEAIREAITPDNMENALNILKQEGEGTSPVPGNNGNNNPHTDLPGDETSSNISPAYKTLHLAGAAGMGVAIDKIPQLKPFETVIILASSIITGILVAKDYADSFICIPQFVQSAIPPFIENIGQGFKHGTSHGVVTGATSMFVVGFTYTIVKGVGELLETHEQDVPFFYT